LKIQDGVGCHLENHDISGGDIVIFGTVVQNGSLNRSDRKKLNFKNPRWQTAAVL